MVLISIVLQRRPFGTLAGKSRIEPHIDIVVTSPGLWSYVYEFVGDNLHIYIVPADILMVEWRAEGTIGWNRRDPEFSRVLRIDDQIHLFRHVEKVSKMIYHTTSEAHWHNGSLKLRPIFSSSY